MKVISPSESVAKVQVIVTLPLVTLPLAGGSGAVATGEVFAAAYPLVMTWTLQQAFYQQPMLQLARMAMEWQI